MRKKYFLVLVLIIGFSNIYSQVMESPFWLNSFRQSLSLKALKRDELLDLTARLYAEEIAQTGHFSHTNLKGQRVQARYQAAGGTHALVGEILGIGPEKAQIINTWLHSEKHFAVIRDKRWTHYGQGFFFIKGKLIYVLLFSQQFTAELSYSLNHTGDIWNLQGQWLLPDKEPVLLNGTKRVFPLFRNQATGKFIYQIEASQLTDYIRLGFQEPGKAFHVTNIFYPLK